VLDDEVTDAERNERQSKLVSHVLEVCHYFFQKYTIKNFPPTLLDHRMWMLLINVIWFELFAVCNEPVRLDLTSLFNFTGFSVFRMFIGPCGQLGKDYYS